MALIIIADDDELVVELVRLALQAEGHVVGALPDGMTVQKVVELKQPDLVILDCSMPNRSGLDALLDIRKSPTAYRTRVLMLTARQGRTDDDLAIRAGANDYLRKPFDHDQLVARVAALLDQAVANDRNGREPLRMV